MPSAQDGECGGPGMRRRRPLRRTRVPLPTKVDGGMTCANPPLWSAVWPRLARVGGRAGRGDRRSGASCLTRL